MKCSRNDAVETANHCHVKSEIIEDGDSFVIMITVGYVDSLRNKSRLLFHFIYFKSFVFRGLKSVY